MSHKDPAYRYEQEQLAKICRAYIEAWESGDQPMIQFVTGMVLGQCAAVYNLSPPGGLLHPSLLFKGHEEALENSALGDPWPSS